MTPTILPDGVCLGLVTGSLILLFPMSLSGLQHWQMHLKYLRPFKFLLDLFKCDDTNDVKAFAR